MYYRFAVLVLVRVVSSCLKTTSCSVHASDYLDNEFAEDAQPELVVTGDKNTLAERWHHCDVGLLRMQHHDYLQQLCRTTPAVYFLLPQCFTCYCL